MNVNSAESLIARHPILAAYREQLSSASNGNCADAASQARSTDGGGPLAGTKDPYLTVEGLQKAWGESDSVYDLNDDGTVDVSDMLALLAMGGSGTDERAPITVEGLMKDWGTVESVYDLDYDGMVGVQDLMMLLAAGGEMSAPPPPPSEGGGGSGRMAGGSGDTRPPLAAPLTGDPTSRPIDDARATIDARPLPTEVAVKKMSDLLISRLEKAGYSHRPPANVHNIVDQFQFRADHRQSILERIAQRYPQGLGLQIRA